MSVAGALVVSVEHVGSTAIAGIHTKPIIDIAIAVRDLSDADLMQPAMEKIGYDYPRDVGISDERVFGKGRIARTHLVHVAEQGSTVWRNYILFRDQLRRDRMLALEYDEIKLDIASRFADDRPSYTRLKSEFIERVLSNGC